MPTLNIGGQQINISEEEAQALFRASTASGFVWVTRANPLPTIGTTGVIYINKTTLDVYLWDSLTQRYIITNFTKEDGGSVTPDTSYGAAIVEAINGLTQATTAGLSNTFITYELGTNEDHDIVLRGSDGSESKLSLRTKPDENTTYELTLIGNNLKLRGSDGSEQFVLLPSASTVNPISYVLTRSVEGDIVLRGSDGSTSMINFKPDTNTTYTLEKDADGNFLFRDSTGNSVTLEDAIGDDFNTTYTLSAEGTTIKLTDSDGNVQSVNLEITDNDTKYEVVKEDDKLYLVSSDGVKVEIDLPEDIDTKYDLKLEDGKLTLVEDGEDKTTVELPEIPEQKVYTLTKAENKVTLSDGEVTNEVDLSEYVNPDVSNFATKDEIPDVSKFATKDELPEVPDVSGFAVKSEVDSALEGKADKSEIPDVSGFIAAAAVAELLVNKADKSEIPDVSNFATKDELPEVPDVSNFATKDEIPDVSNFATKDELPEVPDVSEFVTSEAMNEALAGKANVADIPEVPDVSGFATKDEVTEGLAEKANVADIPDVSNLATKDEVAVKLDAGDVINYSLEQSFENNAINITLNDSKEDDQYDPMMSSVEVKLNLRKDEDANQLVLEAEVANEVHEISRVQLAADSDTKYKLEKVDNQLRLIPVVDGADGDAIVVDIDPDVNTTYALSFNDETNVLTFTPSDDTVPTEISLNKFITANDLGVFGFATTAEVNDALNLKADKTEIPDISNLATKDELPDISGKADKSEIPDVSNFATKDELPEVPDVSNFATKDELPDVSNFATKDELPDISGKADKSEIPDVSGFIAATAVTELLADKADKSEIPDVSGFAVETEVADALDLKADKSELVDAYTKAEVDEIADTKLNADEVIDYTLIQSYEDNGFNITLLDSREKEGYNPVESTVNLKVTLRKDEDTNQLVLEGLSGENVYEISRVQLAADSDTKYKLEKSGNQLRLIPVENGTDGQAIVVDIDPDVNTTYTLAFNNETNELVFTPSDNTLPTYISLSKFAIASDVSTALTAKANKDDVDAAMALKADKTELIDAYTKAEVDSALSVKADKSEIPDVSGFAVAATVTAALAEKANVAEIPDVSEFITANDLPDVSVYATTEAMNTALAEKANVSDVPDISGLAETAVVNEALALKADKTEIPDVSIYATKEELPEVDELFAKNAEISALKDQITVLTRALQELKTPVVETVTELPNTTTSMPNDDIKLEEVTVPTLTSYTDRKIVTAKSINSENMVMESSSVSLIATNDVTVTGLITSGNLPQKDANNKKLNAAISINNNGDVVIKDCEIGQSGYNSIEIGLTSTTAPKNVLIDNVHFTGTMSNNAILIFAHQKDAIITISNCIFDDVSNCIRISNRTNQPATIKFVNCTCNAWEHRESYRGYEGFLILEDYTSANSDAFISENRFHNLDITFENCYGPFGKIEGSIEELTAPGATQTVYICMDNGLSDEYAEWSEWGQYTYVKNGVTYTANNYDDKLIAKYNPDIFPTFTIK